MERALFINKPQQLNRLKDFDRIYYGSEFCQNLIPTLNDLNRVFSIIERKRKNMTLLTPYVTERGLEKLRELFAYLNERDRAVEAVFNDWGVFKLISEDYKKIIPILGRLLTKQQRDPRVRNILLNKQKSRLMPDRKTSSKVLLLPKETPASLYEYFKGSIINVPIFQDFLLSNDIKRAEIDNLAWDMKLSKKIAISMHLPYAYVTTTRLCGLINLTYAACRRECEKYCFIFKSNASDLPFYIRGNAVFYKSEIPNERYLEEKGIDRVIFTHIR